MRRSLAVVILLCSGVAVAFPQLDWAKLFDRLTSRDRAISDAARAEIATVLPRLVEEKPELVIGEIAGLVAQLNRSDNDVARKGAAAFLTLIAEFRQDSATVLSGALSDLIEHAQNDPLPEIRKDSVLALASLNPSIPELAGEVAECRGQPRSAKHNADSTLWRGSDGECAP
ncbi:MAG: hypothetical protein WB992_14170 [Bryobacteraceae bacterium]